MINAIGILAVGNGGDAPPVPMPANLPYGGIKLVELSYLDGTQGAITEGTLPAAAAVIDVSTLTCDFICQPFRVLNGGVPIDFYVAAVDLNYAILANGSRYLAIVPFNTDATLKFSADWEAECSLSVGSDVELIDLGADYIAKQVCIIEPGKFFIIAQTTEDVGRVLTSCIVEYTSPTEFAAIPVVFDLDAIFADSRFTFAAGMGFRTASVDRVSGQLCAAVIFSEDTEYFFGNAIRINANTGVIEDREGTGYSYFAEDKNLSAIAIANRPYDCFEVQDLFLELPSSSGNTGVNDGFPVSRFLFRYRDKSGFSPSTLFTDVTDDTAIDMNEIVYGKLQNLGFTPTYSKDFTLSRWSPYAWRASHTSSDLVVTIGHFIDQGFDAWGYDAASSTGGVSGTLAPIILRAAITYADFQPRFEIMVEGHHPKDFIYKIHSELFSEDFFTSASQVFFIGPNTLWRIDTFSILYDEAESDTLTISTSDAV